MVRRGERRSSRRHGHCGDRRGPQRSRTMMASGSAAVSTVSEVGGAFQHMFPDDDACAAWLIGMRWPDGFVCPACGHEKGWALRRKAHTFECAGCRRQTSVTAGTILHASKLPLTVWFWAAYLMATHSNGISALQLQKQLGIGSYRSAWLLAHKLRASMVDPERQPVVGPGGNRRGQPSIPDQRRSSHRRARTQPRRQDAHRRRHRTRGRKHPRPPAAPKSPPTAPPTSDTSSKPPPIPTPSRKPTAGPATLRSPPIATMSMSSGRPPLTSSCRGSTKSSPTSKDGREASTTGCVASICRPISMSSSFASTAATNPPRCFPLALPPRHQCRTPFTYSMLIEPEPCA